MAKKPEKRTKKLAAALVLTAQRAFEKQKPYLIKGLEEIMKKELDKLPPNERTKKLNEQLEALLKSDPVAVKTKGDKMPFVRHVLRWLKDGTVRLPEDTDNIKEALATYAEKKAASKSPEMKKSDLQQFASPADLLKFMKQHGDVESEEAVDVDVPGGYEVKNKEVYDKLNKVFEQGPLKVYKVTQKDAKILADFPEWMKTRWCVKNNLGMYSPSEYYLVTYKDRVFTLMHKHSEQIKEVEDGLPSPQQLQAIAPAIKFVWPNPPADGAGEGAELEHFFDGYEREFKKKFEGVPLLDFLYWFKLQNKRMTQLLISEGNTDWKRAAPSVYEKVKSTEKLGKVMKRLEKLAAHNPVDMMLVAYYAKEHGIWDEISTKVKAVAKTDAPLAVLYAYLVENRFESAEPIIIKDPMAAADYAMFVLGKRWEEAEATIKKDKTAWEVYTRKFKDAKK